MGRTLLIKRKKKKKGRGLEIFIAIGPIISGDRPESADPPNGAFVIKLGTAKTFKGRFLRSSCDLPSDVSTQISDG